MTAQILDKAIKFYLGYDPGEKVKKHAPGHDPAYIIDWDVPEKKPTDQELQQAYDDNIISYKKTEKKKEVKVKAGEIILTKYPYWKQNNLANRAIELSDKKHTDTLTQEEQDEETALYAVWAWVKDMRAQSNAIETEIDNLETIENVDNYTITFTED